MSEIPRELPVSSEMLGRQRAVLMSYVESGARRPVRRRAIIVTAAVVLLGTLVAAPALGLGGKFVDLFQGSPAPPPVQEAFATGDVLRQRLIEAVAQDRFSPVVAERTHHVTTVETEDGPVHLWAAPTEDGRQCWFIQFGASTTGRPFGSASCDGLDADGVSLRAGAEAVAYRPSVRIVYARVYDDEIVRVDVHDVEGGVVQLTVVAGHALGTLERSSRVGDFVGLNAAGDEVARVSFR
jgi:hypothetical protein